jgi:hypothetical protein
VTEELSIKRRRILRSKLCLLTCESRPRITRHQNKISGSDGVGGGQVPWPGITSAHTGSFASRAMFTVARSAPRSRAAAAGAYSAGAHALGGIPVAPASNPILLRQLGAVCIRRDATAGSSPRGRGFACLGVGGGGVGGGGGNRVLGRAPTATRALSSSSGDGGGGSSWDATSFNEKLAAARRDRAWGREGVGDRAAGGAARGARGVFGVDARDGGRGGGGGGRGGGGDMQRAIALNRLISQEEDPRGLLCLLDDELPNFNNVNVATAFSIFGRLCGSTSFPRDIVADVRFRELMDLAQIMCADGRLKARELANVTHAVSRMSAAGKLAADDADVMDLLAAMEEQVVLVASGMEPQGVANTVYAFAALGREPGAAALAALEAAVVRVGPGMDPQHVANVWWSYAKLELMPGAEAQAALEAAVVRQAPGRGLHSFTSQLNLSRV